uniref:Uncharacterized protein n=1 Tax=Panagrolaimus superbus TaxID=310955 RepID=A0A914XT84_9BILA
MDIETEGIRSLDNQQQPPSQTFINSNYVPSKNGFPNGFPNPFFLPPPPRQNNIYFPPFTGGASTSGVRYPIRGVRGGGFALPFPDINFRYLEPVRGGQGGYESFTGIYQSPSSTRFTTASNAPCKYVSQYPAPINDETIQNSTHFYQSPYPLNIGSRIYRFPLGTELSASATAPREFVSPNPAPDKGQTSQQHCAEAMYQPPLHSSTSIHVNAVSPFVTPIKEKIESESFQEYMKSDTPEATPPLSFTPENIQDKVAFKSDFKALLQTYLNNRNIDE